MTDANHVGAFALGADIAGTEGHGANWPKFRLVGGRFVYLRASYSTTDDATADASAAVRAAGLKPGRYFFPDETITAVPIAVQVRHFAAREKAIAQPGDMPAAFDVEYSRGIRGTGRTRAQLLALIVEIAVLLRRELGYWPVLYSSARVFDGLDTDTLDATHQGVDLAVLKNCPFWCSRYITAYHQAPIGDTAAEREQLAALAHPPLPKFLGDATNYWIRQTQGDAIGLAGFAYTVDIDELRYMVPGETGGRVVLIRGLLALAEASGVFDDETAAAVRAFQTAHGLEADAIIGLDTFALLAVQPGAAPPELEAT